MIYDKTWEFNANHPCRGKDCKDCETCIFDEDLFLNKNNIIKMDICKNCKLCESLVKTYIDDDKLRFTASCKRSKIMYNGYTMSRVIKQVTGQMLPIETPDWCPKNRGVTQECISHTVFEKENKTLSLPSKVEINKPLSYAEKRERLMSFPKRIKWDDIQEDGIYVIPKILSQARKVVRVIIKNENLLRCSEIDEYGDESKTLISIYPKDIDAVFITKVLKY